MPIWFDTCQQRIKTGTVVAFDKVAEFMQNHIVNARPRRLHQLDIEVDAISAATAITPARFYILAYKITIGVGHLTINRPMSPEYVAQPRRC